MLHRFVISSVKFRPKISKQFESIFEEFLGKV